MKLPILALLVSMPAHADIYLGAWSDHLDSGNYNETHNLIAVEHNQITGGYFKNSYSDNTYFIGYQAHVITNDYIDAGVILGAMHGYDKDQMPVQIGGVAPFMSPYVSLGDWYVKPTVMLLGSAVAITFRIDY